MNQGSVNLPQNAFFCLVFSGLVVWVFFFVRKSLTPKASVTPVSMRKMNVFGSLCCST